MLPILAACLVGIAWDHGSELHAATGIQQPQTPTPIMPIDQVRIGARGYGLTVFHGDRIEPFSVEVVSVMRDFNPQKNVIWIRCPDERMQKTGPVAGMSGSPIYLWDENEPHEPGRGGRLIGAFAFGFSLTKDCYVGVQAIQQMRDAANRTPTDASQQRPSSASTLPDPNLTNLSAMLQELVAAHPAANIASWQARRILQVVKPSRQIHSTQTPQAIAYPPLLSSRTTAAAMPTIQAGWPLSVGNESLSRFMTPLLSPYGIRPLAHQPMPVGKAPKETDIAKTPLAPGSVLAIPLVGGDLDLSAVGTVTDVLPDGRVLAFGHAMFAQGDMALPMASGFVHYIVPNLISSFKLAGSGVVRGAVVRDENSGIVGLPNGRYETAELTVHVQQPHVPPRVYHYRIARHRKLQPMLATIATVLSTQSDVESPEESTCRIQGQLTFSNGSAIRLDNTVPLGADRAAIMALLPPLMLLANNDFEPVEMTRADIHLTVEPGMKLAEMVSGRLDTYLARPGETISLLAKFQPYRQAEFEQRFEFRLPEDLPDGDYPLLLCDGASYGMLLLQTRPRLTNPACVGDLQAMIQQVMSIPNDTVHLVIQTPQINLAIDRQEMPKLPSSRRALLAPEGKSDVTMYGSFISQAYPQPMVISGQLMFMLPVRRHGDEVAPAGGLPPAMRQPVAVPAAPTNVPSPHGS